MRRYTLTGHTSPRLALGKSRPSTPGRGEVAVRVMAASLNNRDLVLAQMSHGLVPLSDGAGIIEEAGEGVEDVAVGDRVVIGFMPTWVDVRSPNRREPQVSAVPASTVS